MIKKSYLLGRVMGIPIRIHISLLIVLLLISLFSGGGFGGLLGVLLIATGVFGSVAIHELGHSWVAIRKGCNVREIMLLPIGGIARMMNLPARPRDELQIAIAGPATSLALALLFWLLMPLLPSAAPFFKFLRYINFMLFGFNLLPSFPMDGGRVFRAWMTPKMGKLKATELAAKIGRRTAFVFAFIGLFGIPGLLAPLPILLLIAVFVYFSAGAEYRMVQMQHMGQEWSTVDREADVKVGPPPYAQREEPVWKEWKAKTNAFFNDLFKNWR